MNLTSGVCFQVIQWISLTVRSAVITEAVWGKGSQDRLQGPPRGHWRFKMIPQQNSGLILYSATEISSEMFG